MCIPFLTVHTAYKSRFSNNWKKKNKIDEQDMG